MFFASDNSAPVAAPVLEAMARVNDGPAIGYGNDPFTQAAADRLRALFEAPDAAVHFVATGTAANALSLSLLCPPWAGVLCHAHSHIHQDEGGAPEFFTHGAKLFSLQGSDGRLPGPVVEEALQRMTSSVHSVQPAVLSLTNATEMGTVYVPEQVARLACLAKSKGLAVHLDGARLANAIVATGASIADMTHRAGVDVVSFGASKGGAMNAEAVIIFDASRAREFELRRKRGGHLLSKTRYLAAQFEGWLGDSLWLKLADHANRIARRLAGMLAQAPGVTIIYPTEANIVFAALPQELDVRLRDAGARYLMSRTQLHEGRPVARFVCSWSTTDHELETLRKILER